MSLVIEGGTIVAADRTYKADVLVEGRDDQGDRRGLEGRQHARRRGLLHHAGRHRPAYPSRHAFMGANSADNYEAAPRRVCPAATMVVDFRIIPTATSR